MCQHRDTARISGRQTMAAGTDTAVKLYRVWAKGKTVSIIDPFLLGGCQLTTPILCCENHKVVGQEEKFYFAIVCVSADGYQSSNVPYRSLQSSDHIATVPGLQQD